MITCVGLRLKRSSSVSCSTILFNKLNKFTRRCTVGKASTGTSSAQTKQCMLSLSSIQVTGLMDSIISRPSEPTNLPIPACKVRVGLRPLRLSGLVPIAECHPLRSLCQKELPRQPVLPHRFDQQNQQTRALALQQVRQCPLTVQARQARRARGATENWRKFRGFVRFGYGSLNM